MNRRELLLGTLGLALVGANKPQPYLLYIESEVIEAYNITVNKSDGKYRTETAFFSIDFGKVVTINSFTVKNRDGSTLKIHYSWKGTKFSLIHNHII